MRFSYAEVRHFILRQIDAVDGIIFCYILPEINELQTGTDSVGILQIWRGGFFIQM